MKIETPSRMLILITAMPLCWVGFFLGLEKQEEFWRFKHHENRGNPHRMKLLADPNRVYFGLYNIGDVAIAFGEMKAKSGKQSPGISLAFHDWNGAGVEARKPILQTFADPMEGDDVTPLWMIDRATRDGGIVAVVWDAVGYFSEHPDYFAGGGTQPISFEEIFDGVFDDYIRSVAVEIRELGHPVMLSPAGEFNAIGYYSFGPNGNEQITLVKPGERCNQYGDDAIPDGPERVRDLYRHVIDIFNQEGAFNVTWFMYSHSAYMNPNDLSSDELEVLDFLHPRFYYPGDEYIDWIGNSAYISTEDPDLDLNYAVSYAIEAFEEFTEKPFIIPEFGITTNSNSNRAEKIQDVFARQMPAIPQIRAFAFADADLFEFAFETPRLGNFPEEIEAWREFVIESDDYTDDLNLKNNGTIWSTSD